jgi:uncharacterized protein
LIELAEIWIYPIKSLPGLRRRHALVTACGLEGDRRYMLVDARGRMVTQREFPVLASVGIRATNAGFVLEAPIGRLELPWDGAEVGSTRAIASIWSDSVPCLVVNDDGFFSRLLGQPTTLVYQDNAGSRLHDRDGVVSFADGYPMLLLSQEAVDVLSARLQATVPNRRFRPNLVVRGGDAFIEDGFREVYIRSASPAAASPAAASPGAVVDPGAELMCRIVKPCPRCVMVDVDPDHGVFARDLLKHLAAFRRGDALPRAWQAKRSEVYFGQNTVPSGEGQVHEGARVRFAKPVEDTAENSAEDTSGA